MIVHGVSKRVRKRAGLTVLCSECIGGYLQGSELSGSVERKGKRLIVRNLSFCGLQREKKRGREQRKGKKGGN